MLSPTRPLIYNPDMHYYNPYLHSCTFTTGSLHGCKCCVKPLQCIRCGAPDLILYGPGRCTGLFNAAARATHDGLQLLKQISHVRHSATMCCRLFCRHALFTQVGGSFHLRTNL